MLHGKDIGKTLYLLCRSISIRRDRNWEDHRTVPCPWFMGCQRDLSCPPPSCCLISAQNHKMEIIRTSGLQCHHYTDGTSSVSLFHQGGNILLNQFLETVIDSREINKLKLNPGKAEVLLAKPDPVLGDSVSFLLEEVVLSWKRQACNLRIWTLNFSWMPR